MFHKCRFIVTTECKGSEFCSTRACFSGFCYVNVLLMRVLPLKAHVRHVLVICGFLNDAAAFACAHGLDSVTHLIAPLKT